MDYFVTWIKPYLDRNTSKSKFYKRVSYTLECCDFQWDYMFNYKELRYMQIGKAIVILSCKTYEYAKLTHKL